VRETGSAIENTRRYLRTVARFLTKDPAGKVLLALIGEAHHDPEVARVFCERYLEPQRRSEREMLRHGVSSGELSAELDVDAALDALDGPIFYRALTGGSIPRTFIDRLIADNLERHRAQRPGA